MTVPRTELVGLPTGGPTSLPECKVELNIEPEDTRDDGRIQTRVDAVNREVRTWRCAEASVRTTEQLERLAELQAIPAEDRTPAEAAEYAELWWSPDTVLGATMLVARLYRRKNSPAGVESFGSQGAAYVMRNDPDIAQLLKLATWAGPQVG